ncbi:hypothetical protein N2152v2_001202 [Parachlorella kessleri]
MGGESFDVDVPRTATCEDLKRQLATVARLPQERQRIIFRGRVLQNEERLSEAGVSGGHTLHVVDMPPGAEPGVGQQQAQQAQQGAALGGMDFLGGLLGGFGMAQPGAGPGGAAVLGPFVVDGSGGGGPGNPADFGAMIAQQIAAAFGGAGVAGVPGQPMPGQPAPAPAASTGPVRTAMLETPNVPAPRMTSGPYPHVLTGLNLMTTRLENEYDDAELDPLPRIREYYGRPSTEETMHFLRAARAVLNSSPLLRPTRVAVSRILLAAGLQPLRPPAWERAEDEDEEEYEGSTVEEGDGGSEGGSSLPVLTEDSSSQGDSDSEADGGRNGRARQAAGRRGRGRGGQQGQRGHQAQQQGALRSFPVSAEELSEEEGGAAGAAEGAARLRHRAPGQATASPAGRAGGRHRPHEAHDDMPALESDGGSDSGESDSGRHSDSASEDDDGEEISNEDLLLVAAVSLGELAARFLDIAGASSDDSLWDLLDDLRGLTEVRRENMQQLAGDVQQVTARLYRLGSVWAELSRGMQYLGAALESGNMAVVSAIPGYLTVQGSQARPNLQRPGYPPLHYLHPLGGYFGGQIPDTQATPGMGHGVPVGTAVVDIAVAGPAMMGMPAAAAGAAGAGLVSQHAGLAAALQPGQAAQQAASQAQPPQQQHPQQQEPRGFLNRGPAPGLAVPASAAAGVGQQPPGVAAQQAGQAQQAQQGGQGPPRQAASQVRQIQLAVDSLVQSTRTGVDLATQRVQEARSAMQAVITGREGGVQAILQRAHHTMQALVAAEESLARARQRTEQAAQQVQRALRSQQGSAQQGGGGPLVQHQAVRITFGGPGGQQLQVPLQSGTGAAGAAAGAGGQAPGAAAAPAQQAHQGAATAQQGQRTVSIPLGPLVNQVMQGLAASWQQASRGQQQQPGARTAGGQQAPEAAEAAAAAQEQAAVEGPPGAGVAAFAEQLLGGLGMAPEDRQLLIQQLTGMTQALRQSSIASLDLPTLLSDIRASLSPVIVDVVQQAQHPQQAEQGQQQGGQRAVQLAEEAVPRLTAAVRAVLERHLGRLTESPALQQFMPHLEEMGINLQALQGASAQAASAPAAAAAAGTDATATAAPDESPAGFGGQTRSTTANATEPGAPATAVSPSVAVAPAAAAAQPRAGASPVPAPTNQQPATGSSRAPTVEAPLPELTKQQQAAPPVASSDNQDGLGAHEASHAASGSHSAHVSHAAAPSLGAPQGKPAGLGLGRGLGLPSKPGGLKKRSAAAHATALAPAAAPAEPLAGAAVGAANIGTSCESEVPSTGLKEREVPELQTAHPATAAAENAGQGTASRSVALAAASSASTQAGDAAAEPPAPDSSEPVPATADSDSSDPAIETIPPRPAAPLGPGGAAGPDLAGLMSGLLGPGGPAGGGGRGGGGGGLMDLMGSVMQSPAFMQMAQSPAMQRMAEQVLGGGSGGGSLNLGSLMGEVMGGMMGRQRQGPRSRGIDGVLGSSDSMATGPTEGTADQADLDAVLGVLPAEEAARWRQTIEADAERQVRMAAQQEATGGGEGFSDAYSALRMAARRGASSGLLGILGGVEDQQE